MSRRTVAICGSCATRDNFNSRFNPDYKRWYDTALSNHQSSMLALMSPPVEPDIDEADALSPHEEQTLRADMTRSFLAGLAELEPDYLVIDFSGDAWFGALRLPDGRYLTDNEWKLRKTAYHARLMAAGGSTELHWRTDTDGYFALWTEAMDRFAAFLAEHCPDTHVIVHRLRSVGLVSTGPTDRPRNLRRFARLQPLDLKAINAFRTRMDDHATSAYGWDQIDLRHERYTALGDHPWGAFWVHYTYDYHRRFLAELHQRDLEARLDDEVLARVRTIASAGRLRLSTQTSLLHAADRAQRRRIRQLENRSLAGIGRDAVRRQRTRKAEQA